MKGSGRVKELIIIRQFAIEFQNGGKSSAFCVRGAVNSYFFAKSGQKAFIKAL